MRRNHANVAIFIFSHYRPEIVAFSGTLLIIDLLMGLFSGAVFQHGGVPRKQPINLDGPFPVLNGPFSDLDGPFSRMP